MSAAMLSTKKYRASLQLPRLIAGMPDKLNCHDKESTTKRRLDCVQLLRSVDINDYYLLVVKYLGSYALGTVSLGHVLP